MPAPPRKYGNRCPGSPFNREDIVEVPLSDSASASVIGSLPLGQMPAPDNRLVNTCHDMGVVLGSVNRAACAGNPGVPVFDISDPESPEFLYATTAPTVTGFHSAVWSWDGSILATGWEPGGGTGPRCQTTGAGTALVDFTDPANAYEVAWTDPDALDPPSAGSPRWPHELPRRRLVLVLVQRPDPTRATRDAGSTSGT